MVDEILDMCFVSLKTLICLVVLFRSVQKRETIYLILEINKSSSLLFGVYVFEFLINNY